VPHAGHNRKEADSQLKIITTIIIIFRAQCQVKKWVFLFTSEEFQDSRFLEQFSILLSLGSVPMLQYGRLALPQTKIWRAKLV
jgi:hypothetical protein